MEAADPTKVAGVVQDSSGDTIPLDASTQSYTWGSFIYDIALCSVVAISVQAVVNYVISRFPRDPPDPPAHPHANRQLVIQPRFEIDHLVPRPGLLQVLDWFD